MLDLFEALGGSIVFVYGMRVLDLVGLPAREAARPASDEVGNKAA